MSYFLSNWQFIRKIQPKMNLNTMCTNFIVHTFINDQVITNAAHFYLMLKKYVQVSAKAVCKMFFDVIIHTYNITNNGVNVLAMMIVH